ncbi:MAG: rhomboid family intramembrane serine protease [Acidobacteriia bacterium]|nr:rhomboid family intramembrane serine protease [Terriglobia bacterium]
MAKCVQCGRQLPALTFGRKVCQWCVQHEAAQRGEDSPIQRVEPAPWLRRHSSSMAVTQAIFGINLAVFIAMMLAGVSMLDNPAGQDLVRWGANFGPLTVSGQWWRLLTCVFIHGGLLHIGFNMWCLWDLGRLAESVYGHWTFAVVYLITGLAASLASLIWNPVILSVGASGAIFGIAGALIASFYLGEFSLPRAAMTGMLRSVVVFVGYNLFFGAVIARTDNAAHVGGLLMGLLLGALIAKVAPAHDDFLRRIAVLLVGVLLVVGGVKWLQHSRAYLLHGQNGVVLLGQGKTDEGIAELERSVSLRPNFAAAHAALARAYVEKHNFENAAAEMQRVIVLNPQSENAYYRLGMIYLEQKLPSKAQDIFAQQLRINPSSADGHAGLAAALSDQHRDLEALEEYKRVAALDSGYPGVYYNMGVIQARLKLYDDAITSLLKQRQTADDAESENLLAAVYEAKGMKSEAEGARQKAKQFQASH